MRYTVNYGSAKEPDVVTMVPVAEHEAVRADRIESLGLREWNVEPAPARKRRKAA